MYILSQVTYPQDREQAGKSYWSVLFNVSSQFPDSPTDEEKTSIKAYIESTIDRFTCDDCVTNAHEFMSKNPMNLESKKALVGWMCSLKNNANVHANKPEISCDEFVSNSLGESCETCSAIRKPFATTAIKKPIVPVATVIPKVPMPTLDNKYMSVWNFQDRYPSMKRAMSYTGTEVQTVAATTPAAPAAVVGSGGVVPAAAAAPTANELSAKYPSLANFGLEDEAAAAPEELNGILRPLDSFYTLPASWVGISPSQMNLSYTPEILTNGISVVTQMYMTNAGSLVTALLSSLSLIGISVVAKNSMANYDRLFIQNVAASLLFHTMNFFNPRIKDEVVPDLKKLVEGVTSMDFTKVKEALLFGSKETGEGSEAKHLIDMMNNKNGVIDMKKLKEHRDLRGTSGTGMGGSGGSLTKDEFESMMDGDGPHSSSGNTNFNTLQDVHKKYDYILDNDYL